jgi:predicted Zn-dependent peptidase
METLKRSGQIVVKTNTRSAATGEVLRRIADEFSRLRRERVDERELADAKAYLTGNFPLTLETPDDIATHVLNHLFYDLPLDELETYRQRVSAVAVGDVARVTWDYVKPDRLSVVLVGNAAAFADELRGVGFGRYEKIALVDLDLLAADFRKPAPRQAPGQKRHQEPVRMSPGRAPD